MRAKRIALIAEGIAMGTVEVSLGAERIAIGAGGYAINRSRRDRHRSKRDCHGFRRGRFENYQQKVTPMELKGSKYEKEGRDRLDSRDRFVRLKGSPWEQKGSL